MVKNDAGGILLGEGAVLSEAHIRRLKTAGVDAVPVRSADTASANAAEDPIRRLEALATRFQGITDPLLLAIKKVAVVRLQAMLPPPAR